jgi:ribonuclease HI
MALPDCARDGTEHNPGGVGKVSVKEVSVYTDGACSGNPGPGGWAALLLYGSNERVISGGEPATTNNRMELRAVVEALGALREPCRVAVHTDSSYIANAFEEGWIENWKRRGWMTSGRKPVKNRDLWEALLAAVARHEVSFVKVKGHADDELNNRVDALAVSAMEAFR